MSTAPSNRKLLSVAERANILFGTLEDAMNRIAAVGRSPISEGAKYKRQEQIRVELRREVERLIRGRGRDVLQLLREFVESAEETYFDRQGDAVMAVSPSELLAVMDAGFVAEDDPVVGERCPLCERAISEHTRADVYGEDTIVCFGAPEKTVIISHGRALSTLIKAATEEAQRQFDELTKGSAARANAEDYAAIMDTLAALPEEQLSGIEWEGGPIAGVVAELLKRGPVLDKERLLAVFRDGIAAAFDAGAETLESVREAAEMLANLLNAIFPVRVEYTTMGAVERVEKARALPRAPKRMETDFDNIPPKPFDSPVLMFPPMVEGQTHWLIGSDYGLFYKVDAEGQVTRLENEYTPALPEPEKYYVECESIACGYEGLGLEDEFCPRCGMRLVYAQREDMSSEEAEGSLDAGASVGPEPASSE